MLTLEAAIGKEKKDAETERFPDFLQNRQAR
jgi:hypothetical protein